MPARASRHFACSPIGGARFQGSVGLRGVYDTGVRHPHPPASVLTVSIRPEGPGRSFAMLAQERALECSAAGTRWTDVEVDLAAYSGARVTLRLELRGSRPIEEGGIGWWGSPRIALRPDDEQARPPGARATDARGSSARGR